MTLAATALRNVTRSARTYRLWFLSVASSACVFYLFMVAAYEKNIATLVGSRASLRLGMTIAAIILAIFTAVFMAYSAGFFVRGRYREIGLYRLFGVGRGRIALMLLAENALAGALALVAGIAAGVFLSKFFLMGFARVLDIELRIGLVVDPRAAAATIVVFSILVMAASAISTLGVFKSRLAGLFQAERASEKPWRLDPTLGAISIPVLAGSYVLALSTTPRTLLVNMIVVSILVTLGTWAFARGAAGLLVGVLRRNDRIFLNGSRMIALSNIAHRIGSNARVFFIIAMVSAVSMIALGIGLNVKYSLESSMGSYFPNQLSLISAKEAPRLAIREELARSGIVAEEVLKVPVMSARRVDRRMENGYYLPAGIMVYSASDYAALAKSRGRDWESAAAALGSLASGQAAIIEPQDESAARYLGMDMELAFGGSQTAQTIFDVSSRVRMPAANVYRSKDAIAIPDAEWKLLAERFSGAVSVQADYSLSDPKAALPILEKARADTANKVDVEARIFLRDLARGFNIYLFAGGFLGLVFLFCVCSVLHFKQLMDAREDRARFDTLRKIGMTRRDEIRIAILQVLPLYGIPLGLAVSHGAFALATMSKVLGENFTLPILMNLACFSLVFVCFAALTARAYLRTAGGSDFRSQEPGPG